MADRERDFCHESLQDRDSLVRYLGALAEGLQRGTLMLSSNGERVELKPPALVKLDLQAKTKRSRSQIILKVSWKNRDSTRKLKVEPLEIDAAPATDEQ